MLVDKLENTNVNSEILNWSVNGSTVVFAQRVLISKILQKKPSHVILSHSGYNEAVFSHFSDDIVIRPTNIPFNVLLSSEAFRFAFTRSISAYNQLTNRQRKHKVEVSGFTESYDEIIPTLQQQNIRVILLQQEVITPDIQGFWRRDDLELYRSVFQNLAKKYHLTIVDPRDFIVDSPNKYFENEEYYNMKMHAHIADSLSNLFPSK